MGEGWGDFLATTIRSNSKYSDYPMGAWAANRPNGIRNFPYSLVSLVSLPCVSEQWTDEIFCRMRT